MKLHGVWVDTVVEKPTIWRCRCGAMLSTQKAMMRHVAGDTVCQHRGEGMVAYVPESFGPEAGSEGSSPKQLAGLHDDELLVEKVSRELQERFPYIDVRSGQDDQVEWRELAEAAVAAVRGAGGEGGVDSLAEARGLLRAVVHAEFTGERIAAQNAIRAYLDGLETRDDRSESSPAVPSSGAVPLEPQEENREHVETALAELNGLKDADLGRYERECLEAAEGALRRALSAVSLLQDGDEDV